MYALPSTLPSEACYACEGACATSCGGGLCAGRGDAAAEATASSDALHRAVDHAARPEPPTRSAPQTEPALSSHSNPGWRRSSQPIGSASGRTEPRPSHASGASACKLDCELPSSSIASARAVFSRADHPPVGSGGQMYNDPSRHGGSPPPPWAEQRWAEGWTAAPTPSERRAAAAKAAAAAAAAKAAGAPSSPHAGVTLGPDTTSCKSARLPGPPKRSPRRSSPRQTASCDGGGESGAQRPSAPPSGQGSGEFTYQC